MSTDRAMPSTINRATSDRGDRSFAERLGRLVKEFGSRYRLAKVSGIPPSSLQSYEAGTRPGFDALIRLARAGNVTLEWLAAGIGEMRPKGLAPGASWADIVTVALYEMGTSLLIPQIAAFVPFNRDFLISRLKVKDPTYDTLLAVEADADVAPIRRGDLVLIDRRQTSLHDGVYLVHHPGLALRRAERIAEMKALPDNFMVGRAIAIGLRAI